MIGVVRVKPGVLFTTMAPAGFRMLAAIDLAARALGFDVVITSACDGRHSGPDDPHHRGEAYDLRTHGLTVEQQDQMLAAVLAALCTDDGEIPRPFEGIQRSLVTAKFFGFVENIGRDTEHVHLQLRKGRIYP